MQNKKDDIQGFSYRERRVDGRKDTEKGHIIKERALCIQGCVGGAKLTKASVKSLVTESDVCVCGKERHQEAAYSRKCLCIQGNEWMKQKVNKRHHAVVYFAIKRCEWQRKRRHQVLHRYEEKLSS